MDWLNEKVNCLPDNNGLYKFMCLFLGKKKMTYKEMYLLIFNLNKNKLGEKKAKENALYSIINLYKVNNKTYPKFDNLYDR